MVLIKNYESMLNDFNKIELKVILDTFGQSTIGERMDLLQRAINLLANSPRQFSEQAYLKNIISLHKKNHGPYFRNSRYENDPECY